MGTMVDMVTAGAVPVVDTGATSRNDGEGESGSPMTCRIPYRREACHADMVLLVRICREFIMCLEKNRFGAEETEFRWVFEEEVVYASRIRWTEPEMTRWKSFWKEYFSRNHREMNWENWSAYWRSLITGTGHANENGSILGRAFADETWKIMYRDRPERIEDDLVLVTTFLFSQRPMVEMGEWINIIMDSSPQSTLARVCQLLGDVCRGKSMNVMGCMFYNQLVDDMKLFHPLPVRDESYIVGHVISHYYLRFADKINALASLDRVGLRVLPKTPDAFLQEIQHLEHWYHPSIVDEFLRMGGIHKDWTEGVLETIRHHAPGNYPSSCSLAGDVGILRSVNYAIIRETGGYRFDGTVCTQNFWITVDPLTATVMGDPQPLVVPERYRRRDSHIRGLEDMRLFEHRAFPHKRYALATSFDYGKSEGRPSQVFCVFDRETNALETLFLMDFENQHCQKNWVPFVMDDGQGDGGIDPVYIIYGWNPFILLRVRMDAATGWPSLRQGATDEVRLEVVFERHEHAVRTDPFRGSASPVFFPETKEWHVIIHEVFYTHGSPTRRYRHRVLRMSEDCRTIRATTTPFVFEQNQIEYSIGMTRSCGFLLLHYSTWDNHSKLLSITIPQWLAWVESHTVRFL